ncbi:N-6 DNA Methylase [Nocardia amikacinitolerans]|uniref:N-6 DNA Methylase n=1 Tax=Nocardia amikacinitolerans TaxID=756689 RepID=A0A285LRV4_9NOCA|nr:N-6 DNA methylase [Nocardia amikacinitolerans]SNY86081.1 N-6 DNA Methylase [Nocardia amikacinitolerans]
MPEVSAAEISRLAGVTRATVSNWRRRHDDFPQAIAGTDARPLFDLHQVQGWLSEHGVEVSDSPAADLRTLVRSREPQLVRQVMEALHRSDGGWVAPGLDGDCSLFAAEVAAAIARTAEVEGTRIAFDTLAERAMEGTPVTGVYTTPAEVAKLMAALSRSATKSEVGSVLDPACGSGSLLLAAAEVGAAELHGQDVSRVQVDRTRLMIEADTELEPDVRLGDSLMDDAFLGRRFDTVLCNPPYGQRDWGSSELALDTRWDYGLPPRGEPELAWVQHAIAHLHPGADAVLLLPPAVATRSSGRKIRANLVRTGALRAVIGLAPGSAQPWHIGLQIWILRRPVPGAAVPDALLFVDTIALSRDAPGDDRIDWDLVTGNVVRLWRAFDGGEADRAEVSGVAAAARLVDVLDDEVDLTPARYVRSSLNAGAVSDQVGGAISRLTAAASELTSLAAEVTGWSEAAGKTWRFVTIADLASHGQLEWIRARPADADRSEPTDARRVLTAPDVAAGNPASGTMMSARPSEVIEVRAGDVLLPAVRSDRSAGRAARVAGVEDAGAVLGPHVHALRLDGERLDPWFVAGFLTGAENVSATRTSTVRFDPSRLRIPVLSLQEQQRYGAVFRRLFLLRATAGRAFTAAEHVTELMTTGLTAGALLPDSSIDVGKARP